MANVNKPVDFDAEGEDGVAALKAALEALKAKIAASAIAAQRPVKKPDAVKLTTTKDNR